MMIKVMQRKYTTVFLGFFVCSCYYFGSKEVIFFSHSTENKIPVVRQDIYLLETSGKNYLDLRQLASVESIARFVHHDTVTVLVFTNQTIKYNDAMLALNSTYGVRFEQSEMGQFFKDTPLEVWYNSTVWRKGKFTTEHTSDALRTAVLWKKGGMYFDLDIIVIKDVGFTKPSIVADPYYEQLHMKANCFFAVNKHNELLKLYMTEFTRTYNPNLYDGNGPMLLTKVFTMYSKVLEDHGNTVDVIILPAKTMAPLMWNETKMFFLESDKKEAIGKETNETVAVHIWNKITKHTKVKTNSNCAYMYYVKNSSPLVFAEMLRSGSV